jgi:alanyl aminopeptidase
VPDEPVPAGQLPAYVTPVRYELALDIVPSRETFTGRVAITVNVTEPRRWFYLHGNGLRVTTVSVMPTLLGGFYANEARWEQLNPDGVARVSFARELTPGEYRLTVEYAADFNRELQGLYVATGPAGERYALTKFEPMGARRAFPCFDEPRFKTPYELSITTEEGQVAVGNTRSIGPSTGAGTHTVRFNPSQPLPTYLVFFSAGPWDVVEPPPIAPNATRTAPLPLRGLAARGRGPELAYAMQHTPALVSALESYFGTAYPYDKLDLIAAPVHPSGAMENAGAIAFREPYLLLREGTASEQQRRDFALVTAHELAHQWFGNLVTMQWWDDLWLNEGFATWMEYRTAREAGLVPDAELEQRARVHDAMRLDVLPSARRIRQQIASVGDVRNAFDAITYAKGSALLRMVESYVGEDAFRDGVRAYLTEHRFGSATSDDLVRALSASSHRELAPMFRSFLEQSGVPVVSASLECPRGALPGAAVTVRPYQPLGLPAVQRQWQLPVCAMTPRALHHPQCALVEGERGRIDFLQAVPSALQRNVCSSWRWTALNLDGQGAGYYRVAYGPAPASSLTLALAASGNGAGGGGAAQLAVFDDARASFEAGTLPAGEFFGALPQMFSRARSREEVATLAAALDFAWDKLADDAARPAIEAFTRSALRATGAQLRWVGDVPGSVTMRRDVLATLARAGNDPEVRREGARLGQAYLGLGGDNALHPDVVSPDLAGLALALAVREGGAPVADAIRARFSSTNDAVLRAHFLRALAWSPAGAAQQAFFDMLVTPAVRGPELLVARAAIGRVPAARGPFWAWYREHHAAFVAAMPAQARGVAPSMGAFFCSSEGADELRAFFAPLLGSIEGGERNLNAALDEVRVCAATVAAQAGPVRAHFARAPGGSPRPRR